MAFSRRALITHITVGGVAVAVGPASRAAGREREQEPEPARAPDDAVGMLYDTTKCIGCKACVVACHEANGLEPDTSGYGDGLYDAPTELNATTANIIELYREGDRHSYIKHQCMHCIDPACVGACMIGALQKREWGVVTWEPTRCVGCRYCQMACPFNVPKFEWNSVNPRIVKCFLCSHRLAEGLEPACCEVCPAGAVIFGKYSDLLVEARRRLAEHPDRYVPRIYGEHDWGGTQVLYLSHVPFEKVGLPVGSDAPVPALVRSLQHGIYRGFVAPVGLYAVLTAVIWRHRRASDDTAGEEGP